MCLSRSQPYKRAGYGPQAMLVGGHRFSLLSLRLIVIHVSAFQNLPSAMRSDNVESPIIVHQKNLSGDPSPKGGREERKGSEAATFPYLIRLYIEGHAFWTTASRLWSHAPHVMPASACVPTDSLLAQPVGPLAGRALAIRPERLVGPLAPVPTICLFSRKSR